MCGGIVQRFTSGPSDGGLRVRWAKGREWLDSDFVVPAPELVAA